MLKILHVSDFHMLVPGSVGAILGWMANNGFPGLAHYYSFANQKVQFALASEISRIAASARTVVALTGDIAAWPLDAPEDIDAHFFKEIDGLINALPTGSVLLPMLGNHDWDGLPMAHTTDFEKTKFQQRYAITKSRAFLFKSKTLNAVLVLINSNRAIIPATGQIGLRALNFLQQLFNDGRGGHSACPARSMTRPSKLCYCTIPPCRT